MNPISKFLRFCYIHYVLARYGIDQIVLSTPWFAAVRFLTYLNPWYYRNRKRPRGVRIRKALEELGPIFVKLGQMLSTRRDLIPNDIADELALLQDQVPPFSGKVAQSILENIYQAPIDKLFDNFNNEPLASASIAQVHAANLVGSEQQVVIKLLRPGIKKIIKRDVALMYSFARLVERLWSDGVRLRPVEVIAEYERCLLDELDLMREAANASQLRRNFVGEDYLYIPEIYWPYARSRAIVMERIHGIRISNIDELKQHHINLKVLAERGVEIFFTQVFRDCFFHADMHPGNIFVSPDNPENPQYIAIDFGIIGTLGPSDQRYLAENFLAFFKRDYRRVAELHVESGWVPYETRVDEFESAIRTVCEPIFEKPLKDISCGQVLLNLFQTARRFNMEVQPQLLLLQKTLINIEGLGRQLYPDLDLWNTAKPFLERWLKKQIGVRASIRKIRQHALFWTEKLPEIPDLVYDGLQLVREMKYQQAFQSNQSKPQTKKPKSQMTLIAVAVTLIFTTLLNLASSQYHLFSWLSKANLHWLLGGTGIILLVIASFWRRR